MAPNSNLLHVTDRYMEYRGLCRECAWRQYQELCHVGQPGALGHKGPLLISGVKGTQLTLFLGARVQISTLSSYTYIYYRGLERGFVPKLGTVLLNKAQYIHAQRRCC